MIDKPTVFVLGAGASIPYGFPSGAKLLSTILHNINLGEAYVRELAAAFDSKAVYYLDFIGKFGKDLLGSGRQSVDAFLEHRPDHLPIGKAAIAHALIPLERESGVFDPNAAGGWYRFLFEKMNAKFDDFARNRISFITYNYDRSLEHFLHSALHHSYGKPIEECAKVLSNIPIIHLHGELGRYDFTGSNGGRRFEPTPTVAALQQSIDAIKIISEDIGTGPAFANALELLCEAQHVFFLGFGYDSTNVKRLQPAKWCGKSGCSVVGTGFGFTDSERKDKAKLFNDGISIGDHNYDAITFLRHKFQSTNS